MNTMEAATKDDNTVFDPALSLTPDLAMDAKQGHAPKKLPTIFPNPYTIHSTLRMHLLKFTMATNSLLALME
jgi:hypothetical protein